VVVALGLMVGPAVGLLSIGAGDSVVLAAPPPESPEKEGDPDAGAAGAGDAAAPPVGDAGAPDAEGVTLPRPVAAIEPAYPEGASGEVVVHLEVVVGVDGAVQSVRAMTGVPPFSTAAMSAVASARFEPARKGDRAVAARFVLQIRFVPPAPSANGSSTAATPPAPSANGSSTAATPPAPPNGSTPAASQTAPDASSPTTESRAAGSSGAGPSLTKTASTTPAAPGKSAAPGAAASGAGAAAIDVTVEGAHGPTPAPEPAGVHLSAKAVSRVPGAFGDAFRAVEILPGVVPFLSGLPYFYVRGATPTGTGYFLDGVPVPLLFHVGAGPSVIAPPIIASVDFYPGGVPVAYGRQIGGILAADTVTPPARFSAEASLRVLDAGAYATAPLPGGRGSAFAAGRFSFTQAVLPLITKDVNLGYWDYQAGANYRISEGNRLRVLAFGADDFLIQNDNGVEKTLYKGQFHRVDLALEHGPEVRPLAVLSGSLFAALAGDEIAEAEDVPGDRRPRVRVAATAGTDRSSFGGQGDLFSTLGQLRSVADLSLHRAVRVRAGADLLVQENRFERAPFEDRPADDDGTFAATFKGRTVATFGGFADLGLSPAPYVQLVGGVRVDLFTDPTGDAVGIDPRASARVALFPWLASVTTIGLAHQRPSFVLPAPGVTPAFGRLVLQEALQASQGLEFELPARIAFHATGYLHEYEALTDFLATCGPGQLECNFAARAKGRSYGVELLLRRALTEKLGGQIAYTLSRTERTALRETFAADSDRTHVVHVVLGYEFLPGWHAGGRFTGYSGRPYSLVENDNLIDASEETLIGKRNVVRGPGFFRIDVRLSKTWRIGKTGYVTAVLEGLNVTLAKETINIDCRTQIDAVETCGPQELGPISIPSVGVSGGF